MNRLLVVATLLWSTSAGAAIGDFSGGFHVWTVQKKMSFFSSEDQALADCRKEAKDLTQIMNSLGYVRVVHEPCKIEGGNTYSALKAKQVFALFSNR